LEREGGIGGGKRERKGVRVVEAVGKEDSQ
jgi:hypothetical protein